MGDRTSTIEWFEQLEQFSYIEYLDYESKRLVSEAEFFEESNPNESLSLYERAIITRPAIETYNKALIHMKKGDLLFRLGKYYQAIIECDAAMAYQYKSARLLRARCHERIGYFENALNDYKNYCIDFPQDQDALKEYEQFAKSLEKKEAKEEKKDSNEKNQRAFSIVDDLPPECLQIIFSFLPAKSLFIVLQVSKKWNKIASNSVLWKNLVNRRYNPEIFEVSHQIFYMSRDAPDFWKSSYIRRQKRKPAIVIDVGSGYLRAGFSGERSPRSVFSTSAGISQEENGANRVVPDVWGQGNQRIIAMDFPVVYGVHSNIDCLVAIYKHIFHNILGVDPCEYHIVVSFSPWQSSEITNEKYDTSENDIYRTLTDKSFGINAKKVTVVNSALLALYSCNLTSGLVVDIGFSSTRVTPVFNSVIDQKNIRTSTVGGSSITSSLVTQLNKSGYSMLGLDHLMAVKTVKEKACYVSLDIESEPKTKKEFYFNGVKMEIGEERYLCPEILFDPELVAHKYTFQNASGQEPQPHGICSLIENCLVNYGEEERKLLLENVALTGGSSGLPGSKERLEKSMKCRVVEPICGERQNSVWLGLSLVGEVID